MEIRFYVKQIITAVPTDSVKVESGYLRVSTAECTAYDLIHYSRVAGGLDSAITVIAELADKLEPLKLKELAELNFSIAALQRLGYLLDQLGFGDKSRILAYEIRERMPLYTPLMPGQEVKGVPRDRKWRVIVNTDIATEP